MSDVLVSRTIDLVNGQARCVICGNHACTHGDCTIGRKPDSGELVEILFPVCPACLYGDPDPIDQADKRVLDEHGLAPFLPTRRECM